MMEHTSELNDIKNAPSELILSDERIFPTEMQVDSVKQKGDYLIHSELDIKTEEYGLSVVASTSRNMCYNYDVKFETEEPMVKIEHKDLIGELQGSLEVGSKMRSTPVYKICPSDDVKVQIDEPLIKIEYEDLLNERMQDPLDVGSKIKVEASTSTLDGDTSNKLGHTEEEEKYLPTSDNDEHKSDSFSNQVQLSGLNKKDRDDKNFICPVCNSSFKYNSYLDRHLRMHTRTKPYSCEICKRAFTQKGGLDTHILIHSSEKPHTCNVCQKVFRYKSNLKKHKLIHSGVKLFSCIKCNKSFTQKPHLVTHEQLHTGEKPYTCDLCNKAFACKSYLITHRRLHTGEKPFSCDTCNESFPQKAGLNYHKRVHKH